MASLISSLVWVRRGVSLQHPVKYDLDEKELQRISALAKIELEDARTELERANKAADAMERGSDHEEDWEDEKSDGVEEEVENGIEDKMDEDPTPPLEKADLNDLSEYKLDEYDKEEIGALKPKKLFKAELIRLQNRACSVISRVDVEERDELEVLPTDNLIVTAKTEDEISHLEIYVYEENEENLYIHHDIMLPSFPLCLEWLDFHPNNGNLDASSNPTGSYIAVGTMEPEIEIWSLDTLEAMYPTAILGRPDLTKAHTPLTLGSGKKKRKKTKSRAVSTAYHVDAVLGLSWNKSHRNLLASASADTTIKLWDLTRMATTESSNDSQGSLRSFEVHKDKVQCVKWNDKEPSVLLSGSYDRTVRTFDTRAPEKGLVALLGADVEGVCWDPWETHNFFVSLENGLVLNYDARTLSSDSNTLARSRFTLSAHDGAVSALDINPHIRGCMVTGGTDKLVKIWNITEGDASKTEVSLITSRDLGVGRVFSAVWSPDDPLTVAAAGSTARLQVWDIAANAGVRKALSNKFSQASITVKERSNGGIIGVISDGEDDSGDDD
ncbi:hypothetical protein Clacol_002605 [Clathrus columnatus]|uniref:Uncharacterized protein n=1 Tax=Clathrus columnatus TaxID=1419009 RepID=A0AAV5A5Z4_9AGAM|nr:hypothetical protein Clacol_002605 [Clathrus columnatus]